MKNRKYNESGYFVEDFHQRSYHKTHNVKHQPYKILHIFDV
jgi:hypothetical protein